MFGRVIPEVPFFVIGICIFRLQGGQRAQAALVMVLAVFTVLLHKGVADALVCALAIGAFALILVGGAGFLRNRVLVWFGAISYSLYLVHNYAGRSLIASLQASGWPVNASIAVVLVAMICMAALLTFTVERPAQRAIRSWWKRHRNEARPAVAA
jgi:peptidoglycan/LPS O-acetylase OafA/YrhL